MRLDNDEYRIEDDGIWISRKALEDLKRHYQDVSQHKYLTKKNAVKMWYIGNAELFHYLLKHFEQLEDE